MRALMSLILLSAAALPCAAGEKDDSIRIGGSTTMLPLVAQCAATFMDKYPTWDLVDKNLPKEQVVIYVTGGGSGFGAKAVLDGTVHIGLLSRELKKEEMEKLGAHQALLISKDCLAFAVNNGHPLAARKSLSREDVVKIFSGDAKTSKDVDPALADAPLVVLMRDAAGSATELIQKDVLKEKKFSPQAIQMPSMGSIIKKLEENKHAISYVSSVLALQNEKLKALAYENVEPTNENVVAGKYVLVRPFYLVVKGTPDARVKAFLNFCITDGQAIISDHGYVPMKR